VPSREAVLFHIRRRTRTKKPRWFPARLLLFEYYRGIRGNYSVLRTLVATRIFFRVAGVALTRARTHIFLKIALFGVRSSTFAAVSITWRTVAFASRAIPPRPTTFRTLTARSTATALTTAESLKHSAKFFLVDKSILVAIQSVEAFFHPIRGLFLRQLAILVGVRFIEPSHHLFRTKSSAITRWTIAITWGTTSWRAIPVTRPTITAGASHGAQFVGSDSTITVTIHPTQHHDGLVNFFGFQNPVTVSIQSRYDWPTATRTSSVAATRRSSTGATTLTFAGSIPVPATLATTGSVSIPPAVPLVSVSSAFAISLASLFTGLIFFSFLSTFARLVAVFLSDRPIRRHYHCGDGQQPCCKLVHISVPWK
jgi:hypothetical protein